MIDICLLGEKNYMLISTIFVLHNPAAGKVKNGPTPFKTWVKVRTFLIKTTMGTVLGASTRTFMRIPNGARVL